MTIANLGQMAFAGLIGPVTTIFNWSVSLFVPAIIISLAWLLLQFLKMEIQVQQVVALENRDSPS